MKVEVFCLLCCLAYGFAAEISKNEDISIQPVESSSVNQEVLKPLTRKARLIGGVGIGGFVAGGVAGIGIGGFKGLGGYGGPGIYGPGYGGYGGYGGGYGGGMYYKNCLYLFFNCVA